MTCSRCLFSATSESPDLAYIRKDAVKSSGPQRATRHRGTRLGDEDVGGCAVFGKEFLGWNIRWLKGFGERARSSWHSGGGEVDLFGDSENVKAVIKEGIAEPLAQLGLYKTANSSPDRTSPTCQSP